MTKKQKNIVFLSLGSNMGGRMAYLSAAEEKISNASDIEIISKSKIYETEPWNSEAGKEWFLNQAIQIETSLGPEEFLAVTQNIESDLGRTSKHDMGPREIDIDILLYGDTVIESDHLIIPHRHMYDRQFVLIPLFEIAPDLKDPVSGKRFDFFLRETGDKGKVIPYF